MFWPLLGTTVAIESVAANPAELERAEETVHAEIQRLEAVFTVFDPTSLLRRWISEPATSLTSEFIDLLGVALAWHERTGGLFNLGTRDLTDTWTGRSERSPVPSNDAATLSRQMAIRPYHLDAQQRPVPSEELSRLDLNGIAKGFILDRAAASAWGACALSSLVVNAGGDLVHRGIDHAVVSIEHPTRCVDNAPAGHLEVRNAAVATSGPAHRAIVVDGEPTHHVFDPRTGTPARPRGSATVIAPDATTADAVATVLAILQPDDALDFVDDLNRHGYPLPLSQVCDPSRRIEAWVVDEDGATHLRRRRVC